MAGTAGTPGTFSKSDLLPPTPFETEPLRLAAGERYVVIPVQLRPWTPFACPRLVLILSAADAAGTALLDLFLVLLLLSISLAALPLRLFLSAVYNFLLWSPSSVSLNPSSTM